MNAAERPQIVDSRINLKGAVMRIVDLTSREGCQRFLLELESGAWPREDELKQFFKELYSTPTSEPEIDVSDLLKEMVVVVTQ
jgi:hypothetical protein